MNNKRQGCRRLGIVGGMGSLAGVWLLKRVLDFSGAQCDQEYPEILLHSNSNIPDRTKAILGHGETPLDELQRSIGFFNECGIEVAALACMTAYYYYPALSRVFNGVLINPIDITLRAIKQQFTTTVPKKIGLIGTTGLIRSGIFQQQFGVHGLEIITLDEQSQNKYFMDPIYRTNGIKAGCINRETSDFFWKQEDLLLAMGAEALIGACSEIPLIADRDFKCPFYNVFELLAKDLSDVCYQ